MASLGNQTLANEFTSYYISNPTTELGIEDPNTKDIVTLTASGNELLVNGTPLPTEPVSNWSLYPTLSNNIEFSAGNNLTNIDGNLYFNDELLAKAGDIQNVADWSLYPALSNVNFNLHDANSIQNMQVIGNSTVGGIAGFGFGLYNYWLTQNQGDFVVWNPTAAGENANRPLATFEVDTFRIGTLGKTLSGTTWYNEDNTPFEVINQDTLAPLYSAQPNIQLLTRNFSLTTPALTITNTTPMEVNGDMEVFGNSRNGSLLSSTLLPIPAATYTNNTVQGNFSVGTLDAGQLFPYPSCRFAVDEFKVGNFVGESGGENAPAVNVNARTLNLGSIASTSSANLNGISASLVGSATAGITSPVTTLTGGIVNITGAGGCAITSPGGLSVTGGTVAINSAIGCTITGGGGVAVNGGLGVSVNAGGGVSVNGGGYVSLNGGGGINVNDLGGATFRGGNVLLTLGANQTIDNGTLTLAGASSSLLTSSIEPNSLGYLAIQDPGNTSTNVVSMNNVSALTSYGLGMSINNVQTLEMNPAGVITNTTVSPNNWVRLRANDGIYVQNVTGSLPAPVYCGEVNLLDGTIPGGGVAMTLSNQGSSNFYANGNLVAYQSAVENWASYPASQTVNMSGGGIINVQNLDFFNTLTNPTLKNSTVGQSIEVASDQGLFVKNVNSGTREKIDAKTFVGDNIFLDGTVTPPSLHMNAGNDTYLYRISGDQQGTQRITSTLATNGGFLLDSDINVPTFNLSGNTLELKAKDPTTDPTGNTLKVLTSVSLPSQNATAYASVSCTNTTIVTGANTPTKIPFNILDANTGAFSITSGSIIVPFAGTYELIPSIIFSRTGGSLTTAYFWLEVNGVQIANSSTQITLSGNGEETCPAAALITPTLNAGDSVAIYFASSDNTLQITATASSTSPYNRPATPSAIMTLKLLQSSGTLTTVDLGLQNRLQIVPVGTPTTSIVKYTGVGGVGSPSSWVPDQSPPISGGTNNGWRFTKATGSPNTAKINWYPFNPYYPSGPSIGVPPSTIIRKCDLEALWFVISTTNNINVQGLLYLQIYTYDYVNGSSTTYTNRWDYCSPTYSGGMTTTPFTLQGGFKYLVCAVDPPKTTATPGTSTTITYANGQFPSQRTTTKLRDPYDIHTDIPHVAFTNVAFVNSPTPQPADPSTISISAIAVNTASATVTTALDFTIEAIGFKSGGINYEYTLNYS